MNDPAGTNKSGFRIEPPSADPKPAATGPKPMKIATKMQGPAVRISFFYYLLGMLSIVFFTIALWYLYIEWTGNPLPPYLRLPNVG